MAKGPKFSAFIMTDTGRKTRSGGPMLDYALTNDTRRFALDAVVLGDTVQTESPGIGALCRLLDADAFRRGTQIQQELVNVIKAEGSRWAADPRWQPGEDLSRRARLLEGSVVERRESSRDTVTLTFRKPPRT
jgi:phosphate-selective porin